MEIRRAAQCLRRGSINPLSSLVSNSSASRCRVSRPVAANRRSHLLEIRQFSTSTNLQAAKPTTTTSAPPSASTSPSQPPADLSWLSKPRSTPPESSSSLAREHSLNNGSSESDIRNAFSQLMARRNLAESTPRPYSYSPFGRGPLPSASASASASQNILDVSRMAIPVPLSPNPSPYANSLQSGKHMLADLTSAIDRMPVKACVPLRLNPSAGRTVAIDKNVDLGRGLRLLEMSCARNKVRHDFNRQRFHERGGLKRKRLRRERWRKKFMEGFKATVGRVRQLKNQGW